MCNILHWIWFPGGRKEDINFNMCTDTSCISPSLKTLSTWRKYNQIQQGVYITIFGWIYFIREKTSVNKSINKHALPGIDISWAHFDPKIGRKNDIPIPVNSVSKSFTLHKTMGHRSYMWKFLCYSKNYIITT